MKGMVNLKRFFKGFVAVALSIVFISTSVSNVSAQNKPQSLKGVIYDGAINEVTTKASLNERLTINELVVKNDKVIFIGTIKSGSTETTIQSIGEAFQPQNIFLQKAEGLTLALEPDSNYEFLSFTIERQANKELLLPVNGNLANETVFKLAVRDNNSNRIYYFEDLVPSKIDLKQVFESAKTPTNEEQAYNNAASETWFFPFLDKTNAEPKQLQEEKFSIFATSPVAGIPAYMFLSPGSATITSSEAFGYYIETVEWPVGSGNMLNTLLKWSWVHNDPDTIPSGQRKRTGNISLDIADEAQYLYNASTDEISLFDNRSFLRIRNPEIEVGIANGSAAIFSKIVRDGKVNSGSTSISWWDMIGLLPFGDAFSIATTFFGAITYKTESRSGKTLTYHDTVSGNELAYGNAVRDYKLRTNGEWLGTEGDNLNFEFEVCVPTDKPRKTGNHTLFYNYDFDVYSRNAFGLYTVLKTSVDRNISGIVKIQ